MRFLFVAPRFHTNQHFIVKALQERGHQVMFLVSVRGQSEEYSVLTPELLAPSSLSRLLNRLAFRNRDSFFYSRSMVPDLVAGHRFLKRYRPDVVIVRNPDFLPSFFFLLLAMLLRHNIVIYTQDAKFRPHIPVKMRLLRAILLDICGYAWITPVLGEKTTLSPNRSGLYYLPFIYDGKKSIERPPQPGNRIGILCVGKFEPRKNHLLLLAALEGMWSRYPLHLSLVGESSIPEHARQLDLITQYIRKRRLEDRVTIRVNLSFSEMQQEYEKNQLFVLPSTREPAAVSLVEAMGHGLAVICSSANGTRCYLREDVNGYVFADGNAEDLAMKIEKAISSPQKLASLREKSLLMVRKHHDPEKYHAALMAILRKHFQLSLPV
ncbi:MAG: glycosyltransferase family 4 protein [Thermodesulfobacteriota bacterium]